jgi:adenine deaminase
MYLNQQTSNLQSPTLLEMSRMDGSAVTLDERVRNLVSWTSTPIALAVECVTAHPAALLGITDKKGSLNPGLDADLVVLDDAGNLYQTWKFGEKVFDVERPVKDEKQEAKKVAPRKESIPFGERYGDTQTGQCDFQRNQGSLVCTFAIYCGFT